MITYFFSGLWMKRKLCHISNQQVHQTSAPELDEIDGNLLKNVSSQINKPLVILTNKIFTEGSFPKQHKKTVTKPIYKKGGRTNH